MASDRVIDIEALCAPTSEEQPVGPYWRDDAAVCGQLYAVLDSARSDARRNERRMKEMDLFPEDAIERRNYEKPNWTKVIDAATSLLGKSKDLWATAWLTEALAREYGFRGLRDGFNLTHCLCERYWEQIHPRPDDLDGIRFTLAQLDGDLWVELIPLMPITSDGLTTANYDQSTEMEGLKSEADREAYRAKGVIGTAEFEARVGNSGAEFLGELLQDAQAAKDEFTRLSAFLDERCGDDAPASTNVSESFQQSLDLISELVQPNLSQAEEVGTHNQAEAKTVSEGGLKSNSDVTQQTGWDRDRAFIEISRHAELFEKYEPNSPVASILRQAVYLGQLSWREMMSALADDPSARSQILKLTGVRDDAKTED